MTTNAPLEEQRDLKDGRDSKEARDLETFVTVVGPLRLQVKKLETAALTRDRGLVCGVDGARVCTSVSSVYDSECKSPHMGTHVYTCPLYMTHTILYMSIFGASKGTHQVVAP